MIDVSFLFEDPDFCVECTLIRRPFGSEAQERQINAVIQPATAEDISQVTVMSAYGFQDEIRACWTQEHLMMSSELQLCDRIRFNGRLYDVVSVSNFSPNGDYYHALLVRIADE